MRQIVRNALVILLLGCFGYSLFWIFKLRFERGDIYPPYSSLRADPIGCKGFYESLESLNGIDCRRNFRTLELAKLPEDCTLFYIGSHPYYIYDLWDKEYKTLWDKIDQGSRLVITCYKQPMKNGMYSSKNDDLEYNRDDSDNKSDKDETEENEKEIIVPTDNTCTDCKVTADDIGFDIANKRIFMKSMFSAFLSDDYRNEELPETINWLGVNYFEITDPNWVTIYNSNDMPVAIEKSFGQGQVVILADSYMLSNEAMVNHRKSDLLAWLIGDHRTILFDESHLGIFENPGVMGLARKYSLGGFLIGFVLWLIVFLWSRLIDFMPLNKQDNIFEHQVTGNDIGSGFVTLLSRHIPLKTIVTVAFQEWKKSYLRTPAGKDRYKAKVQQVEQLISQPSSKTLKEADVVRLYNQVGTILSSTSLHKEQGPT